jgi:type IV pilus assembly protein PilV
MIEILVTVLILAIGMLGLAALQGQAHISELESYQRGQALVLLQDIAGRMENNMNNTAGYVTASTGATNVADCTAAGARADIDLCEWSKAVEGSSETAGGTKQGAMINGRGCVATTATANVYLVSVVWQGLNKTSVPSTVCGKDLYDSESSRRAVTMTIQVPDLAGS